ncbi:MAG: pirin-like C-terminal cupin domain-containing protein [Microthrixaceae bacterium]
MSLLRNISRVITVPPAGPGFDGPAHTAAAVIPPSDFEATDPFFLMMDDRISDAGHFGGEHPHAGIETVTFMLKGSMEDLGGKVGEGDVEWMTAGGGIVHSEQAVVSEGMRLLQLWVVLPENQRHIAPRVQLLAQDRMPVRREPGVEARLYSGRSGGLSAETINAVPITLLDVRLQANSTFEQELPSSYNGFLFVLEGAVSAGDPPVAVVAGQVGWLDRGSNEATDVVKIRTDDVPARVLLYAGERQDTALAARGPFVAGSEAELAEYFAEFRRGAFPRASAMRSEVNEASP